MATSRPARRSAKSRVADGAMVDMSTTRLPAAAPDATPASPKRTASTSGVSDTIVITMSLAAAASAGLETTFTPSSPSSAARPGVLFQALTVKPARATLAAMAPPIVPSPTNPTRIPTSPGCLRIECSRGPAPQRSGNSIVAMMGSATPTNSSKSLALASVPTSTCRPSTATTARRKRCRGSSGR